MGSLFPAKVFAVCINFNVIDGYRILIMVIDTAIITLCIREEGAVDYACGKFNALST